MEAQIKDEKIGFSSATKYYWKMWDSLKLQKELFQKWKSKNGKKLVVGSILKENLKILIYDSPTTKVNKTLTKIIIILLSFLLTKCKRLVSTL